jgi:hypothetical protein
MTKNGWEQGTVVLPSAEFGRIRKMFEEAERARKTELFAHTQTFWKGLTAKQKRDRNAYRDALDVYIGTEKAKAPRQPYNPWYRTDNSAADAVEQKMDDLSEFLEHHPHRRATVADMEYPTNRTLGFGTGSHGYVSFDRETNAVTWSVSENNHAVEDAHESPEWATLQDALSSVKWTRGTGGYFTGNDEYNTDGYEYGGGENYVTSAYGPIGEAEHPRQTMPYQLSNGARRDPAQARIQSLSGQSRVTKGRPAGGQFSARSRSDSNVTLR